MRFLLGAVLVLCFWVVDTEAVIKPETVTLTQNGCPVRIISYAAGYKSDEMIGTDRHWEPFFPKKRPIMADLIIEGDTETIHELYDDMKLRKSTMVEGAYEAEYYFSHLGEEGTHLYFNAAPIKDEKGNTQGAIVTYQDFSERVKMTQKLKRREAFVQNLIQNSIDGIIAYREQYSEDRSLPRNTVDTNPPVMINHDAVDDRQTHPRAFPHIPGREIRVEYPVPDVIFDSLPGVAHGQLDIGTGGYVTVYTGRRAIHLDLIQIHFQKTAVRFHGVCRIGAQVDDDLLDLIRIGLDRAEIARDL